jgi:hypothetical protein
MVVIPSITDPLTDPGLVCVGPPHVLIVNVPDHVSHTHIYLPHTHALLSVALTPPTLAGLQAHSAAHQPRAIVSAPAQEEQAA